MNRARLNLCMFTAQVGFNSIVGYLFYRLLAVKLGVSAEKDVFDIAYSVPYIIMSISGFSFLHSIVTTHFSKMLANGFSEMDATFSTVLNLMLLVSIGVLAVCIVMSKQITEFLAPGMSSVEKEKLRQLILWMCPLVLTLGISTFLSSILVAYEIPLAMEFPQLVSRLGVIIWMLFKGADFTLSQIATGLLICSIVGMLFEWLIVVKWTPLRYSFVFIWKNREVQGMIQQGGGLLVAAVLAQMSMSYMRRLASFDVPGTIATMTYALSLVSPLSLLIGKPLSLVFGPQFIRFYEREDWLSARTVLIRSLGLCLLSSVLAVIILNSFALKVIYLLYGGGNFDHAAAESTREILILFNLSIPATVLLWVSLLPLLNGRNTQSAAMIYTSGYVTHLVLSYLLFHQAGKFGLAWAYTISVIFQASIGILFVYRDLNDHRKRSLISVGQSI